MSKVVCLFFVSYLSFYSMIVVAGDASPSSPVKKIESMSATVVDNVAAAVISPASKKTDKRAAQSLIKQLRDMASLQAQFTQRIKDNKGKVLHDVSGSISVKRPRRLYWHTTAPYEHLVVTDGQILWLYDAELEQVSKQAFTADLDKAPALLLSGDTERITNQYNVSIIGEAGADKASPNINLINYELLPIAKDGLFSRLTISFLDNSLVSMSLQDSFDQLTLIEFSKVEINPSIDDKLFEFTAPVGVDVINND